MTNEASELAERIRLARVTAKLTQAQVADRLGISRGAVTLWESENPEHRSAPSISTLKDFAEVVGVSLISLLGGEAQENADQEATSEPPNRMPSRQTSHFDGCWSLGPAHYKCACKEISSLRGWAK